MRISSGVGNYDAMMALPELKSVEGKNISPADTNIEFCGVSFSYDGTDTMALSDVSFTAPAGKITAIVGPSGGGKSTIAHLIPRFWDVTDGHITIGGIDIQEIPEEVLMQQVSFVFRMFTCSGRASVKISVWDGLVPLMLKLWKRQRPLAVTNLYRNSRKATIQYLERMEFIFPVVRRSGFPLPVQL